MTDTPFHDRVTTVGVRDLGPSQAELMWSASFEADGIPASEVVALLEGHSSWTAGPYSTFSLPARHDRLKAASLPPFDTPIIAVASVMGFKRPGVFRGKMPGEITVFITQQVATCSECGEELGRSAWITLDRVHGALCLACADLDGLVFLSAGDTALTRHARKHSTLSAVVLRWSRARKRYERQGLLVEAAALEQAEAECLADSEVRARQQERAAERRAELDRSYVERFAERVRELYPGCPSGTETVIAEHACLKYSGRIGRSAAAKSLDEEAVRLAVVAHVRHAETNYDALLARGFDRHDARTQVGPAVDRVSAQWSAVEAE